MMGPAALDTAVENPAIVPVDTRAAFDEGTSLSPQRERMVELVHRRVFIELYHEDAKTLLGWDQYQGRLWQGFHRNTFLITPGVAFSFLVWTEWNERQLIMLPGRPRGALSPSEGSTT